MREYNMDMSSDDDSLPTLGNKSGVDDDERQQRLSARRAFICRQVKRYLFWTIGFPCYSRSTLLERCSTLPGVVSVSELDEFEQCSDVFRDKRRYFVLACLSLIYTIKNFFVPYITVRKIDFEDLDANSTSQWIVDENTIHVVCHEFNCTQFYRPETGLTLDIRHFPVIPACYPTINAIYPPTVFLGPYAALIHSVVGFVAFAFGVVLPLHQLKHPQVCEPIMFLVAPNLSKSLLIERIKKLYDDYKASYINYSKLMNEQRVLHLLALSQDRHSMALPVSGVGTPADNNSNSGLHARETLAGGGLRQVHPMNSYTSLSVGRKELGGQHSDNRYKFNTTAAAADRRPNYTKEQFANDCLPTIRLISWNKRAQNIFVRTFWSCIVFVTFEFALILLDMIRRIVIKIGELSFFRNEMLRSGCRAYYLTNSGHGRDVISPDLYALKWTILTFADNLLVLGLVGIVPSLAAVYYLINCELNAWRLELNSQLNIMCEITRMQLIEFNARSRDHYERNRFVVNYTRDNRLRPTAHTMHHQPNSAEILTYGYSANVQCSVEAEPSDDSSYHTKIFRQVFLENTDLTHWSFKSLPMRRCDVAPHDEDARTDLNGKIATQQLVLKLLAKIELTSDKYLNLLEKLYILFRLFSEQVKHSSETTAPLAVCTYLITYGITLITVWHSHLLHQFSSEHLLLVFVTSSWTSLALILMSNFHAKVSHCACAPAREVGANLPSLPVCVCAQLHSSNKQSQQHSNHRSS